LEIGPAVRTVIFLGAHGVLPIGAQVYGQVLGGLGRGGDVQVLVGIADVLGIVLRIGGQPAFAGRLVAQVGLAAEDKAQTGPGRTDKAHGLGITGQDRPVVLTIIQVDSL